MSRSGTRTLTGSSERINSILSSLIDSTNKAANGIKSPTNHFEPLPSPLKAKAKFKSLPPVPLALTKALNSPPSSDTRTSTSSRSNTSEAKDKDKADELKPTALLSVISVAERTPPVEDRALTTPEENEPTTSLNKDDGVHALLSLSLFTESEQSSSVTSSSSSSITSAFSSTHSMPILVHDEMGESSPSSASVTSTSSHPVEVKTREKRRKHESREHRGNSRKAKDKERRERTADISDDHDSKKRKKRDKEKRRREKERTKRRRLSDSSHDSHTERKSSRNKHSDDDSATVHTSVSDEKVQHLTPPTKTAAAMPLSASASRMEQMTLRGEAIPVVPLQSSHPAASPLSLPSMPMSLLSLPQTVAALTAATASSMMPSMPINHTASALASLSLPVSMSLPPNPGVYQQALSLFNQHSLSQPQSQSPLHVSFPLSRSSARHASIAYGILFHQQQQHGIAPSHGLTLHQTGITVKNGQRVLFDADDDSPSANITSANTNSDKSFTTSGAVGGITTAASISMPPHSHSVAMPMAGIANLNLNNLNGITIANASLPSHSQSQPQGLSLPLLNQSFTAQSSALMSADSLTQQQQQLTPSQSIQSFTLQAQLQQQLAQQWQQQLQSANTASRLSSFGINPAHAQSLPLSLLPSNLMGLISTN